MDYGDNVKINTDEVGKSISTYLISTPKALGSLFFAFYSGHLWVHLIFTYFVKKKSGKNFLDGFIGKLALGITWIAFVSLPIYYWMYKTLIVSYDNYMEIILSAVLVACFIQFILLSILTCFKAAL